MVNPVRAITLGKEYISWKYKLATKYKGKSRVALSSFPRSGNTWLRVLIENATGEKAGSIYQDRVFERSAEGIVIKTHSRDSFKYNKAIILVRNPLDAFISHFKWRQKFGKKEIIEWDEHIDRCILLWGNFYKHWLNKEYPCLIVHYEDLRKETKTTLLKVTQFLGKEVSDEMLERAIDESSLEKLRENKESHKSGKDFFNKGQIDQGKTQFTPQELSLIKNNIGEIANQIGYNL